MISDLVTSARRRAFKPSLPLRGIAGALALCSGVGLSLPAQAAGPTFPATPALLKSPESPGWVVNAPFSIPQGRTAQFIHADCPSDHPVALNGGYAFDSVVQNSTVSVGYLGPRVDVANDLKEWGWEFAFANGAPAGTTVTLSLLCTKLSGTAIGSCGTAIAVPQKRRAASAG